MRSLYTNVLLEQSSRASGINTRIVVVPARRKGVGMEARISLVGGNPAADLESLDDWLEGEPELAGRIRVSAPVPREEELGALAEVLVAAVSSGGLLSVLATSLHAWLSQPRGSDVRIRVQGDNGRAVEIDAERVNAQQAEDLLRQVLDFGRPEE
jgi:Effector Associated Constant Component 1